MELKKTQVWFITCNLKIVDHVANFPTELEPLPVEESVCSKYESEFIFFEVKLRDNNNV